jgi:hypothetical protein
LRRVLLAGCLTAFAGAALAQPAITVHHAYMRSGANYYAPVVQSVPRNAQIDVQNCGGGWCYGSWRGVYGFLPELAVAEGGPPPGAFAPPPPPLAVTAPLLVAPGPVWGGPSVGFGVGFGHW